MPSGENEAHGGSGSWNRRDADLSDIKARLAAAENDYEKLERLAMSISYALFGLPDHGQPNGLLHRFADLEQRITRTYIAVIALLGTFIVTLIVAVVGHWIHP